MNALPRVITLVAGTLLVVGATVGVFGGGSAEGPRVEVAQEAPVVGSCRTPAGDPSEPAPSKPIAADARVSVRGSTEIETSGYTPGAVVETETGETWVSIRDQRSRATSGYVARIDGDRLGPLVRVVDGCAIGALASGSAGAWAATCDTTAPEADAGAEIVLVTAEGPTRRFPVPTPCIGSLVIEGDVAWAGSLALANSPSRLWRVDLSAGVVQEPIALGDEALHGVATTPTMVWTVRRSTDTARLVGNEVTTGKEVVSIDTNPLMLLGVAGNRLWAQDETNATLVAFDASTGEATSPVRIPDLVDVAFGPSGPWFVQARTDDLTISVGTLDDTDHPRPVVTMTGIGPDRTGLPYLPVLSITSRGVWLGSQNRLFLVTS